MSATSSNASSPIQTTAKSSRVCLNCRRKKKRCDKALPSCGRCTYSLEVCQHEDDAGAGNPGAASGPVRFEALMSPMGGQRSPYLVSPVLEHVHHSTAGQSGTLNPSMFAPMDAGETVHTFAMRCLRDVLGSRQGVENVVAYYFNSTNSWFTIIEKEAFDSQLEEMWSAPSAEMGVVILCMFLVTRSPQDNPVGGMNDAAYLSAKTLLALVQSKVALSLPLLQAQLLISLYEFSHAMPQQAYMSVGACCTMSKAFGWHGKLFWAEERQSMAPRDLKMCSILWWAIVFVDCLVFVGYPDQKFPLHTSEMDFSIPFPETLDQYLNGFSGLGQQSGFLDGNLGRVETIIWPEANSAWYLRNALQQLAVSNPPAFGDRDMLSDAITAHTLNVMGGNYRNGTRAAVVGTNFIALMKINQPYLLAGRNAMQSMGQIDPRPIETVRSVINSIYSGAQALIENTGNNNPNGSVAPSGAFGLYYAALLLISHANDVLHDPEWQAKVEVLKSGLEVYSRRWTLAERYLESINLALSNRLGRFSA
ncbi:hypothetical protein GQ53DRAFT_777020 [Thozetella sp. PMI_491]|nr:hypothetical protein GQ53DRAFT_777020 [Thozetella sp. PMI_491]